MPAVIIEHDPTFTATCDTCHRGTDNYSAPAYLLRGLEHSGWRVDRRFPRWWPRWRVTCRACVSKEGT